MDFKSIIRDIPDYPKKGIIFKDITTLLKDPKAFQEVINVFYEKIKSQKIDKIITMVPYLNILKWLFAFTAHP